MNVLFDEIEGADEWRRKLIENGQKVCQQQREGLVKLLGGKQILSDAHFADLLNSFTVLSSTLSEIGKINVAE